MTENRDVHGRRTIAGALACALTFAIALYANSAGAENYAFLVAVGKYDVKSLKPLAYTRNDIIQFRQALLDSGFDGERIVMMHDDESRIKDARFLPTAEKIRKEFARVVGELRDGDSLIVGLAGHGVQFQGEAKSYFCPLDANLEDPDRARLIALSEIYEQLDKCPARQKLLLVDACRNDPQSQLSRSRDLVDLESVTRPQAEPIPEGILALFSCSAGQQSFEFPELKHGVFFHHVLEAWNGGADDGDKELTLDELVTFTRKRTQAFARVNLAAIQTPELKGTFAGTWVLRDLKAARLITNSIGMQFRLIPEGEFKMGSSRAPEELARIFKAQSRQFGGQQPVHRVRITRPFYMGVHEVTLQQFREFITATKYRTEAERDPKSAMGVNLATGAFTVGGQYSWLNPGFEQTGSHPVVNVSWNDATAFCEWLSRKDGREVRLPTEAEWEYACRAGSETLFEFGDDPEQLVEVGNTADTTLIDKYPMLSRTSMTVKARDGFAFTAPVGSFRPNAFGLYDMHGNVREWCQDWFTWDYYSNSPLDDPTGPTAGPGRARRDGGWANPAMDCRSASRTPNIPTSVFPSQGFRVVMIP